LGLSRTRVTLNHLRCLWRSLRMRARAARSWRIVLSDCESEFYDGTSWQMGQLLRDRRLRGGCADRVAVRRPHADSERRPKGVGEAGAAFASPTIVHFSTALFLSALLQVPWQTINVIAVLWGLIGLGGTAYTV